jgi:DNA-binding NarL/FixJ family response regulator
MTKILIASPDPTSRKAIALLLTHKLQIEHVFEAADGDSLARQVVEVGPDILLLDKELPGLVLPDICFQLRLIVPNLQIVMLSVDESVLREADACQADFIHKGASFEQTLAQLQTLIKR